MKRREFIHKAAALGLSVATGRNGPLYGAPAAPIEVRGHVVAGGKGLAGVAISDGYQSVVSDGSGEFSILLSSDSGPFLVLTVPSSYWTNRFYISTAEAVKKSPVFHLNPLQQDDRYTAIYMTDVHLGEGNSDQSYARFQATIDEINALDPLPAFCWVGGDITLQGGKGQRYVELMSQLKVPVRNAVGNHEMLVRELDPRESFQRLFGPTYYSFNVGQVHYVTLDGCHIQPRAEGYKNVEGLLSARELHWLADDLRQVPDEMAVVVAIHIPLISDYPLRRGTTAEKVPYWVMQNADEVVDLLTDHGVSLVLQGHLHENERNMRSGIEFVESISVCGRWWKAADGALDHGVSGEPRGYRILEVDGSTVRHQYKSSAESRTDAVGEIAGRPSNLQADRDCVLSVNIFDATAKSTVAASLDERRFELLTPGTTVRYHEDLEPAHHWKWTIPGSAIPSGQHMLRVQVREPGSPLQQFEHAIAATA